MEAESTLANRLPGGLHGLIPVAVPVLLLSIGYLDPGKWAATVESGSRFGCDLVALMLVFNLAAILCHYLSARIVVVTGRDLAQICRDEYDQSTCMFLGVQTELSVILLDLTMILGTAHGLNLLFGWDLFTCVFSTAIHTVLFPLFPILLEYCKEKFLFICIAGFTFLSFVLGVLITQPEVPLSLNGTLTKLSGESAFALMSLLGASIMPHNFYLHSSMIQQHRQSNTPKDILCQNHFFAILCVFSGIYLVDFVLMNSAANMFYSTGPVLLTFQDAMSLLEQVFGGPIAPVAFLVVLFVANQTTALTWSVGGQVVVRDFLKVDIPGWLHCATIRIIAIIPALYCVWSSGDEGMYQLLIFTQVLAAVLLPSSVIPLFRIAASRPIMGVYKISPVVEFLSLVTFIGMLSLKIIFIVEMIFGNRDWMGNLRSNMESTITISYIVLLITICASLCLMLWLAATPLKSASSRIDVKVLNWDTPNAVPDSFILQGDNEIPDTRYLKERYVKQEPSEALEKALHSDTDATLQSCNFVFPETIMEPDQALQLSTIEENSSGVTSCSTPFRTEEYTSPEEMVPVSTIVNDVSEMKQMETSTSNIDSREPVEKAVEFEGDLQAEKDYDEGDTWEPDESSKGIASMMSDGPGSYRSLSGKSEEGGNGTGSLSRLAGLGRAARRQLAAILDDFWGQLYNLHGQTTSEARTLKLDVIFGVDSKGASLSQKIDTSIQEFSGCFPSAGGRGSDSLANSTLYDSPTQQRMPANFESSYGVQSRSLSLLPNHIPSLDAYLQNGSHNGLDYGERRYSSVRNLPSSESWAYQPTTGHGFQMSSYQNRIAKDRSSNHLSSRMESPAMGVTDYRDSLALAMGQGFNGLSRAQAPSYHNVILSRDDPLPMERPYHPFSESGTAENVMSSANTKKYHSSPDIHRNLHLPNRISEWERSNVLGSSIGRTNFDESVYLKAGTRSAVPSSCDGLSSKMACGDALSPQFNSSDYGSLWSKTPFEQFGVADNNRAVGSGAASRTNSVNNEASSFAVSEAKLLQSFRNCIMKLLKLEGSDWLFKQNDGADEDLIELVAAREKFLYEVEAKEMNQVTHMGDPQYTSSDRGISPMKNNDATFMHSVASSVPHCGEGCVWKSDLIVSFGVWCIHRILDLSLMESRPELWGKYTYVLNRLQGIIDPAFSKPRSPMMPCFCLQFAAPLQQQRSSPSVSNVMLPPASRPARGKCTTATMLLDSVKDVESAISSRKGPLGTAAGVVAFPKGKENIASVLKRYKRRLSNKPVGITEGASSRKAPITHSS